MDFPIIFAKFLPFFFGTLCQLPLVCAYYRATTVAPCGMTPNFTFCDTLPSNFQQGCRMRLHSGAAASKAFCEGRICTWEQLPGPSPGLTLPSFRVSTKSELEAQPPPSQIAADIYSCQDIDCLCRAVRGTRMDFQGCYYDPIKSSTSGPRAVTPRTTLSKCTRKEYRMLSTDERTRYHNALLQLKQGFNNHEYNRIAFWHSDPAQMPGAHNGPIFVCWHREYLKRLETALRAVDPSVCLPYWDSSLDWRLSNPSDSVMFSESLMGFSDGNGYVTNGFLANFVTADGDPIRRQIGFGELFPLDARDYIINTNQSYNIFPLSYDPKDTACNGQWAGNVLESRHDNVHVWCGGDMGSLASAPQDPLFFKHHCFIDYIWEQWRQKWQTREQREKQFPPAAQIKQCSGDNPFFQLNATMVPFVDPEIPNWVCLSNNYTDFLYTYAPSPSCQRAGGCGSMFLFCDTTNQSYPFRPTCASKIKPEGDCRKFLRNSEQPCFNSTCDANSGRCVRLQRQAQNANVFADAVNEYPSGVDIPVTTTQSPTPLPLKSRLCYDNHECCNFWAANGTCGTAKISMSNWCPGTCQFDGCQSYPETCSPGCKDIHSQCKRWSNVIQHPGNGYGQRASYGNRQAPPQSIPMNECRRNPHFMARNCAMTCNKCDAATWERCAALTPVDYVDPATQS